MIVPYTIPIEEVWTLTDNVIENTKLKKPFAFKGGKCMAKIVNKITKFFED